jgi:hypothetical protein
MITQRTQPRFDVIGQLVSQLSVLLAELLFRGCIIGGRADAGSTSQLASLNCLLQLIVEFTHGPPLYTQHRFGSETGNPTAKQGSGEYIRITVHGFFHREMLHSCRDFRLSERPRSGNRWNALSRTVRIQPCSPCPALLSHPPVSRSLSE